MIERKDSFRRLPFVFMFFASTMGLEASDCNRNGLEDAEDLLAGTSSDCNDNGIPDECDLAGRIDFGAALHLPVSYKPVSVIAADLDGDGDRDLAVAGLSATSILIAGERGEFAEARDLPGGGTAIAAEDFDGDGDLDLAVVHPDLGRVAILMNGGQADFVPGPECRVEDFPGTLATGDMDGDGAVDVIVANQDGDRVSVLKNAGDGALTIAATVSVGVGPKAVALADLDGDGDLDAAVANSFHGNDGSLSILVNDGKGSFSAVPEMRIAKGPTDVIASDLDGDGDQDLALAHYDSSTVSILLNGGRLDYAAPIAIEVLSAFHLVASDLDRDGDRDLVVSQFWTGAVAVLRNGGDASFVIESGLRVESRPQGLACEDLDGDGAPDIITADSESDTVTIVRNDGNGRFLATTDVPTGRSPNAMAIADLDGDGTLDIAVANANGSDVAILRNDGAGAFQGASRISLNYDPEALAAGDVDGDGDIDLVVRDDDARVSVYASDGAGAFEKIFAGDGGSKDVRMADLDRDGDLDLLVADLPSQSVMLLRNTGQGAFDPPALLAVGFGPLGMTVADFDGDGDPDFVALGDPGSIPSGVPFWNDGSGGFTPGESFLSSVIAYTAEAGDLDGDGDSDLVVAGPYEMAPGVAVIKNAGAGTFSTAGLVISSNDVRGLGLADLDADGDLDVLAAEFRTDHIAVFVNQGDATFAAPQRFASGREPVAVAAADFDGDGDLDMAALNKDTGDLSIIRRLPPRSASSDANGNGIPDECDSHFIRGDANADGCVNVADAVPIVRHLFLGEKLSCPAASDANDDDRLDTADAVFLLAYLFRAGSLPEPVRACGIDPTPNALSCDVYPPCRR